MDPRSGQRTYKGAAYAVKTPPVDAVDAASVLVSGPCTSRRTDREDKLAVQQGVKALGSNVSTMFTSVSINLN
jgi:hypothetical protein